MTGLRKRLKFKQKHEISLVDILRVFQTEGTATAKDASQKI